MRYRELFDIRNVLAALMLAASFIAAGTAIAWSDPTQPPPSGGPAVTSPIGAIGIYGGSSVPTGWLPCNGSAVSRNDYADLFAVIGTAYGAGDGLTTFNVPDLRGRSAVGVSGTKPRGQTGGASTLDIAHSHSVPGHVHSTVDHVLTWNEMASHTHGVTDPGHSHTVTIWHRASQDQVSSAFREAPPVVATAYGTSANATGVSTQSAGANWGHNHGNTGNAGATTDARLSSTQSILNPYQVVSYVIKY